MLVARSVARSVVGVAVLGCRAPELLSCIHTSSAEAFAEPCIHFDELASGPEEGVESPLTACIIHGLLGAGKNLRTFSKSLQENAEGAGVSLRAVLVDQRNHGRSAREHLHPPHTLQSSARDVVHLFQKHYHGRMPEVVIGHSMGGKVALELVKQLAATHGKLALPKQVWVLDARPGIVDAGSGVVRDVGRVLHAVQSVPLPVPSREWLSQYMREQGFSPGVTQWLGSNLTYEAKGRYTWTFNVDGALHMFDSYCKSDYFPLLRAPPPGVTINILRAAKSDRWDAPSVQAIQEAVAATAAPSLACGTTRFFELQGAGHWVHVDNPNGLVEMISPSLIEASQS